MDTEETINAERAKVAGGGIWNDENLAESLDWQGESSGSHQDEGKPATHVPKTLTQQENEIFLEAGITPDVMATLTRRLERHVDRNSLAQQESYVNLVNEKNVELSAKVATWVESLNTRTNKLADEAKQIGNVRKVDIDRLEEKILALEERLSAMVLATTSSDVENNIVMREAAKIVRDRAQVEDAENASTPSIVQRLDTQISVTESRLNALEPHYRPSAQAATVTASNKERARKRFGRLN